MFLRSGVLGSARFVVTDRRGGVSRPPYDDLDLAGHVGDDEASVTENRARLVAVLGVSGIAYLDQVHGVDVAVVEGATVPGRPVPVADAQVTAARGVGLAVLTADCVPVLLADGGRGVIGAAHAGWKGALSGVIDATVKAMEELGARRSHIVAAIGPCIAQRSYEVGPEFPAPFLVENPDNADFFAPSRRSGHHMFDIGGYVARRLGDCGVELLQRSPNDTVAEEQRFFSYRRATLRGEKDYGRGLSVIVLQD